MEVFNRRCNAGEWKIRIRTKALVEKQKNYVKQLDRVQAPSIFSLALASVWWPSGGARVLLRNFKWNRGLIWTLIEMRDHTHMIAQRLAKWSSPERQVPKGLVGAPRSFGWRSRTSCTGLKYRKRKSAFESDSRSFMQIYLLLTRRADCRRAIKCVSMDFRFKNSNQFVISQRCRTDIHSEIGFRRDQFGFPDHENRPRLTACNFARCILEQCPRQNRNQASADWKWLVSSKCRGDSGRMELLVSGISKKGTYAHRRPVWTVCDHGFISDGAVQRKGIGVERIYCTGIEWCVLTSGKIFWYLTEGNSQSKTECLMQHLSLGTKCEVWKSILLIIIGEKTLKIIAQICMGN